MRGGGSITDPLLPPAAEVPTPAPGAGNINLPTQLGGRAGVPEYDDALPGFSGNFSASDTADPIMYPRRFDVPVAEITAEQRDELPVPIEATYRVAIPNDLLEL
jgi:hypothetical protein